jgi:hypothetical protein
VDKHQKETTCQSTISIGDAMKKERVALAKGETKIYTPST